MSKGKGGSAPSAPNFQQMAQLQAQSSQQATNAQTQANRPSQYSPFASSYWTQGPNGEWSQRTALSGGLGAGAQNLESQIGAQGAIGTGDEARKSATDAYYKQATSRLDPEWSQREEATRAQLANQGLDPGSEAYDNAMGNLERARNDAYSSAENQAQTAGNQAQALTFGENLQSQMAPYQQLGALQGLTQQNGFSQAGAAQPTQYLPAAMAAYNGALQGYGIDQAGKNSTMSGLGQLGGSAMMAAALM
ncbi:hypothetical protein [Anaeromyxobacter oryzisoli]|uniref:hypothetical protein n=1 Tax=Anaeromyxobacter oryzisoli TaxID=2925408 RepID=UPI001F573B53|nr:hypothetical protein [Anaeromyxobacter sp. SG63]